MVAYHRLNEQYRLDNLDYKLPEGMHIITPEGFSPIGEATRLLNDAEEKAQAIIKDAESVRESERRKGYQEGLIQGKLQAVEETLRQCADLDARLQMMEQDLTTIILTSLRKLIDGLDVDAQAMAIVRGALKQMRREKKAELRISPEQVGYFQEKINEVLADFPGFELIDVIEDVSLTSGQVVVETSIGRVEGDLGSYYKEFEEIIREIAAETFSLPDTNGESDTHWNDDEDRLTEGDGGDES